MRRVRVSVAAATLNLTGFDCEIQLHALTVKRGGKVVANVPIKRSNLTVRYSRIVALLEQGRKERDMAV